MRFSSVSRKRLPCGLKSERQCGLVGGHSWDGTFEFTSRLCSSPPLRPRVCRFLHICLPVPMLSEIITPLGGLVQSSAEWVPLPAGASRDRQGRFT